MEKPCSGGETLNETGEKKGQTAGRCSGTPPRPALGGERAAPPSPAARRGGPLPAQHQGETALGPDPGQGRPTAAAGDPEVNGVRSLPPASQPSRGSTLWSGFAHLGPALLGPRSEHEFPQV